MGDAYTFLPQLTPAETIDPNLFVDVALQFGATLELERLLPMVIRRVVNLLEAERGLIALCDAQGHIQRAVPFNLDWSPSEPPPVSLGLIEQVVKTNLIVALADAQSDEEFRGHDSIRVNDLRFVTGVPIEGEHRVIGVIYLDSRANRVQDMGRYVAILQGISKLVGTAIQNARLFEEQHYRMHLMAWLVHDLRTPLMVVDSGADYLIQSPGPHQEVQEVCTEILHSAQRMSRLIENTLELSRMQVGALHSPNPEPVSLDEVLPRHLEGLKRAMRRLDVGAHVGGIEPGLPPVMAVEDQIWLILDNLVFNAIKHAGRGTDVVVSAKLRADIGPPEAVDRQCRHESRLFRDLPPLVAAPSSSFVQVDVQNQGQPLSAEMMGRLFEGFSTENVSQRGIRSTGIGLTIVEECTRQLGGCVWASASSEAGTTTFSFTLPTHLR